MTQPEWKPGDIRPFTRDPLLLDDNPRPLGELVAKLKEMSCAEAMPFVIEAIEAIHRELGEIRSREHS